MYHDLPATASFWSFLLAVDEDLAETVRTEDVSAGDACTQPTTFGSREDFPSGYPSSSASD